MIHSEPSRFGIFVAFLPDYFDRHITFSNLIHWYVHDFVYYFISVHRSASLINLSDNLWLLDWIVIEWCTTRYVARSANFIQFQYIWVLQDGSTEFAVCGSAVQLEMLMTNIHFYLLFTTCAWWIFKLDGLEGISVIGALLNICIYWVLTEQSKLDKTSSQPPYILDRI